MLSVEYTLFDVVKRVGVKRDTLNDWKIKGYIKPSRTQTDSRGMKSFFNFWELHCIVLFMAIVKQGISRKLAAEIVDSIRHMNILEPNIEYKRREYLVSVRKKDGELESKFYSMSDFIQLNQIHEFFDFSNMYIWNFKNIVDEVEVIIKDKVDERITQQ